MQRAASADLTLQNRLALDAQGVGALKATLARDPKAAAREVGQQFEAMFLNMVMKSMREATPRYDELETFTVDTFRSLHDQQMVQGMVAGNGTGLAALITQQIERLTDPSRLQQPIPRPKSFDFAQNGGVRTKTAASAAVRTSTGFETPADFVANVGREAVQAAASLGLSPHLMLAHAALESGWGKKPIIDAQGNNSHNLFGIKADKGWTGRTVDIITTEYVDGVAQKRVETFRAYDSYADAFADYAQLLARRYADATRVGSDAAAFADRLQDGGYATDPRYAQKLARVADHPALQAFRLG